MHLNWKNSSQQKSEAPEETPAIIPFTKDVAALKPRASQFGAPVIFKEEPTFTPKNTDAQSSNPLSETDTKNTNEKDLQQEVEQKPKKPQPDKILPEKLGVSPQPQPEDTPQPKPIQTAPQAQPKPEQPIKKRDLPTRHQSGNQTEDAAPITKKLTFADLARGFIQTIKNEGEDLCERKGNENIRPDLEEMKLLSYKQKVVWFIQNEFRIRGDEEPPHPESIVKCYTIMKLDGDGNIIKLELASSTGVERFDTYYLDVLKSAAPFPPLPQHIRKPFIFPFTMVYYTNDALNRPQGMRRKPKIGVAFR